MAKVMYSYEQQVFMILYYGYIYHEVYVTGPPSTQVALLSLAVSVQPGMKGSHDKAIL